MILHYRQTHPKRRKFKKTTSLYRIDTVNKIKSGVLAKANLQALSSVLQLYGSKPTKQSTKTFDCNVCNVYFYKLYQIIK